MQIPKQMVALIKSARGVVKARLELRLATGHEASKNALDKRREALRKALDVLERDVVAFDQEAERQAQSRVRPPFDWAGLFNVGNRLIDLAHKVRAGAKGPEVVRGVQEVIDAEFTEVR